MKEGRKLRTHFHKLLPTAIDWKVYEDLSFAVEEARKMDEQERYFVIRKNSAPLEHKAHFEREHMNARTSSMNANSFVVSLRRRGFKLALEDLGIKRTIIDEDHPEKYVSIGGQQQSFFPSQSIIEVTGPDSKWGTSFSR